MRIDVAAAFASDTAALDLPALQFLEHLAECWHKLRIPEVAHECLGIPAAEEIVTVLRDDLAARQVSPTYAAAHLTDELIARSYTTPTSGWLTAAGAAWDAALVDEARDDAS